MVYTKDLDRLRAEIVDRINEADIYFKCSGHQNEHSSDLSLEEWYLENPDLVASNIIEAVRDYLKESLIY